MRRQQGFVISVLLLLIVPVFATATSAPTTAAQKPTSQEVNGLVAYLSVSDLDGEGESAIEVRFFLMNVTKEDVVVCYHITETPLVVKCKDADNKKTDVKRYPMGGFITLKELNKDNFLRIRPGESQLLGPFGHSSGIIFQSKQSLMPGRNVVAPGKYQIGITYESRVDGQIFGFQQAWKGKVTAPVIEFVVK